MTRAHIYIYIYDNKLWFCFGDNSVFIRKDVIKAKSASGMANGMCRVSYKIDVTRLTKLLSSANWALKSFYKVYSPFWLTISSRPSYTSLLSKRTDVRCKDQFLFHFESINNKRYAGFDEMRLEKRECSFVYFSRHFVQIKYPNGSDEYWNY